MIYKNLENNIEEMIKIFKEMPKYNLIKTFEIIYFIGFFFGLFLFLRFFIFSFYLCTYLFFFLC